MKKRIAIGAIIKYNSKFLLVKKTAEHDVKSSEFHPYIDFLKGGVKEGESLTQALKRELKEEINATEDIYDIIACVEEPLIFKFKNSSKYDEQETWFFIIQLHDCIELDANPDEVGEIYLVDYETMLNSLEFKETKDFIIKNSSKYGLK